ncbi:cystatin-C-like [Odontesthes bonariensis]|uniref:cystatin-C-like n=1 Tax=Odontesthes bonariensis TaxID=219752 RepID=UPI003F58952C
MQWTLVFPLLAAVFAVVWSNILGGFSDADINDEEFKYALNFAVVQHNRRSNDIYLHNVAEVVRAQSQVVEGTNYVITVKLVKNGCRKDAVNEEADLVLSGHTPYQCTFTVWSRPWLSDIRLLDTKC